MEDIEVTHVDADMYSGRLPDGSVHDLRFAKAETREVGWIKRDAAVYVILGSLVLGFVAIAIPLGPTSFGSRVVRSGGMLLCMFGSIVWHGRIRRLVTAEQCAAKLNELERAKLSAQLEHSATAVLDARAGARTTGRSVQ